MKFFSLKKNKIEVIYKDNSIKYFYQIEPSYFNNFCNKLKNNSFLFFLIFLPFKILKYFFYSLYFNIKRFFK
jgi:hypothetical protein